MKHTIVPILKYNNKRYAHNYPSNEIKSGHIITIRGDKYLALVYLGIYNLLFIVMGVKK